jgi:hypothetical protein
MASSFFHVCNSPHSRHCIGLGISKLGSFRKTCSLIQCPVGTGFLVFGQMMNTGLAIVENDRHVDLSGSILARR